MSAHKVLTGAKFEQFLKNSGCNNLDDLYVLIGYGRLTLKNVVDALTPDLEKSEVVEADTLLQKTLRSPSQGKKTGNSLVQVDGMDDLLVRFAKCCSPIPGDPIIGFITLGRGIAIHRR